jgi:hypothetical protein
VTEQNGLPVQFNGVGGRLQSWCDYTSKPICNHYRNKFGGRTKQRSESLSGKKIFCNNSLDIRDHVAKDIADGWAEQRNNDHDDYSDQDKN